MVARFADASRREATPASLNATVYESIRRDIVLGKLRPNSTLSEQVLAEELEVSRTPTREALTRLAAEGLIRSERRRWIVHEHSIDEIRQIYEVRSALEGQAAALAAQRATRDRIAELLAVLEKSESVESFTADSAALVGINDDFHDRVVACAGNEALRRAIESASHYYFNYELASSYSADERRAAAAQHRSLARAIEKRDAEGARRIAVAHIEEAFAVLEQKLPHRLSRS